MKIDILILLMGAALVVGCSSTGRVITGTALGAGGAAAGYYLSHGKPAAVAGGAAAGVLLSEGLHYYKTKAEQQAFERGYQQAASDSAKRLYWAQQRLQRPSPDSDELVLYPVPIPAQEIDGVRYQPTTRSIALPK